MNKTLLSSLIAEEKKRLTRLSFIEVLKNKKYLLYTPNKLTLLSILLVLAVFILLSYLFPAISIYYDSNAYQNIISIHAGIGIIIFALVIFIAENFRDREGRDRGKVLLKVSNIFPITLIEILIFFIFFLFHVNIWIILLIFLNGIFVIISLWKIIKVSLSQSYFIEERNNLFSDKILESINLALNERIGNFLFLKKLDSNEIKLKFSYLSDFKDDQYYSFNLSKNGIIADINLIKLAKFSELIENSAVQNNYIYFEDDKKTYYDYSKTSTELRSEDKKIKINSNRYILKKFNDEIIPGRNKVFCVEKVLIGKNEKLLNILRRLTEEIFIVKKRNNFKKEIRQELSEKKDQLIEAVRNKQIGKIEELIDFYLNLIESFLGYLKKYKLEYSFESAINERTSLFSEWKEITWLFSDLRDIFEKAIESRDRNIILQFSYLPNSVAIISINYNDHYLFQKFLYFYKFLYWYAKKIKDVDLEELMIEKTWFHLQELADFSIETKLLKEDFNSSKINSLKDYAVFIFIILQELLKDSYEKKDFSSFEKFNKVAVKIFRNFKPSISINNVESYKSQLTIQGLDVSQKQLILEALEKQKNLESIEKEINFRRNQMFFGLVSYILSQLKEKNFKGTENNYFEIMDNNLNFKLQKFTDLFIETNKSDAEHFWNWDFWELKDTDEAQWIDFKGKLAEYYCFKVLKLLSGLKENEVINFKLPLDREFTYLAGKNDRFYSILDNIAKNKESWINILPDTAFQRIDTFKKILADTIKRQEKADNEQKRITKISGVKVKELIDEFTKSFNEEVILRDFFKKNNLYINRKDIIVKNNLFGINTLTDKAIFFDKWHVIYPDLGNKYGIDLASSEDSEIIQLIARNSIKIKVNDFDAIFKDFKKLSDLIIITTHNNLYEFLENTKNFKPSWYKDIPESNLKGFQGWYYINNERGNKVPVIISSSRKIKNFVMVLDKNALGTLIQYTPAVENNCKNCIKDIFYIDIRSFSEDIKLLEAFISKPPEWLIKIGSKIEQENYLKEHVLVKIFESFEFKINDNFKGYILEF